MKSTAKLSQDSLRVIKEKAKGKSDFFMWDSKLSGFALRLRNGKLAWFFQYEFGGKDYRLKIGDASLVDATAARSDATRWAGQVVTAKNGQGVHPAHERAAKREAEKPQPLAKSFASIIPTYLASRTSLRERSFGENKRYLEKDWQALHSIALADITRGGC